MENLFLDTSKQLIELSQLVRKDPKDTINAIENGFKSLDADLYENEDAGVCFGEILEQMEIKVSSFTCKFLGRSDKTINELFSNLWFKHTLNDCPECGCEVEEETDGGFGYEWTEKNCTNCEWSESNEPDWDLMRKSRLDY